MGDPQSCDLARLRAIAAAALAGSDVAHDLQHVLRVENTARAIALQEGADVEIVCAAALLHELVNLPKDHPESHRSGELCADEAARVLSVEGVDPTRIARIAACVRVHGFSRGVVPDTLEGCVLQDADRLDAIGAIGIARCFATTATMRRPFYDPADPFCERREPDDKRWGVDHFYRKLLRLGGAMHTATAREIAKKRTEYLAAFLVQLRREISGA